MEYRIKKIISITGFFLVPCLTIVPASAQMSKESWNFNTQNRASIAALMKQVDDGDKTTSQSSSSSAGTTLVCGGGSSDANSSAMGNSSCIILNNSTGNIELGQDSTGDQTSNAESDTTANLATATDEVLATLDGSD